MDMNWIENDTANPYGATVGDDAEYTIHYSVFDGVSDSEVQLAINACTDKACELLEKNIREDSRYLLFGWDLSSSTLTIVVTDDGKEQDSQGIVKCQFAGIDQKFNSNEATAESDRGARARELADDVQYWIKDYLTTCAPFLRYSLIAAFHRGSRANCTLL